MKKWLIRLLCKWLNPCRDCAYNGMGNPHMDRDEDESNPYNWGDGQPIETSTNNIYYKGEQK